MGLPIQIKKIPDPSIHRSNNSIARAVTRTPRHHYITPVLKLFHWLKIPERIHFKILLLKFCRPPNSHTFANSSPSSQAALPDHLFVSPFLDPRSLLISCYPK